MNQVRNYSNKERIAIVTGSSKLTVFTSETVEKDKI